MSMDNIVMVEITIAEGHIVEAHLLPEGTPILFGNHVWHVVDCHFVSDDMTGDVEITMIRYDVKGKAFSQKLSVEKRFGIQTLWLTQRRDAEVIKIDRHIRVEDVDATKTKG